MPRANAAKLQRCSLHFRPQHCGPFTAVEVVLDLSDLPTFSPFNSLSRPHLANDEAHALRHGYVCSESTSASLRPETKQPKTIVERLKRLEVQGVSFTLHLHRKNQEARRQPNRDGLSGQCIIWSFKVHKT